jgi:hypothetical protein
MDIDSGGRVESRRVLFPIMAGPAAESHALPTGLLDGGAAGSYATATVAN